MRNIMRCNIYTRAQSSHEKSITMKKKGLDIYTLYIEHIFNSFDKRVNVNISEKFIHELMVRKMSSEVYCQNVPAT